MKPRIPLPVSLGTSAFSTRTAREHGIGAGRLRGADLARPFHGIRSSLPADDVVSRARAFTLRMPDAWFFCTVTAAAIMGIPMPISLFRIPQLHVGVPAPMRACRAEGTIGHKLQVDDVDLRKWFGLPVTTPARTWCDLAAILDLEDLVAAGDYIIHKPHPLAIKAELEDAAAKHPGRRGRPRLRIGLDLLDGLAESAPESIVRVVVVQNGIVGLHPNYPIADARGRVFARADLCFPAHRVIFEYQGDYHRSEPDRWRKDRTRIARLTAAGWHVVEIAADELRDRRMLLQLIRDTLALYPAV